MVNSKFSFKKLILIILEVNFYYIFTKIIAIKLGIQPFNNTPKEYFLLFFSIIFNRYWFITAYFMIYILSPYFNILIHSMDKRTYKKLIITMLTLWCIIPTIFGLFSGPESILGFSRYTWLVVIYFIGGYIRLYPIKIYKKLSKSILIAVASFITMLIGIIVIYKFKDFFKYLGTTEVAYFWHPNTIPMLILSVSIFEIFLNIKLNYNKIINALASTTLAIYMMHDGVLRKYLWTSIFKTKEHLGSKYSIIYIIATSICIFCIGAIIDLIRQLFEKITIKRFLDSNIYLKMTNKLKKAGNKLLNIL